MKRCIVCGNVFDDKYSFCGVCGNPLVEITDEEGSDEPAIEPETPSEQSGEDIEEELKRSWAQMQDKDSAAEQAAPMAEDEGASVLEQETAGQEMEAAQPDETNVSGTEEADRAAETETPNSESQPDNAETKTQEQTEPKETRRPRRMRSGPQIYGQDSMNSYTGAQGVIRRDVRGSAADTQQQGMPQNGPMNGQQGMPQNGPMNGQQGMPQGGPAYGQQGMPQGGPAYGQQGMPSGRINHLMETAQGIIRSPLLLIAAIFMTVYVVGSVLAVIMRELNYTQISNLLGSLGLPSQVDSYVNLIRSVLDSLETGAFVLNLLFCLPELLLCIGLWIVCINVRTTDDGMSGAGFTFMRINVIIRLIEACLIMLLVLVLSVVLTIAAFTAGTTGLTAAAIVLLVLCIAVTMAIIMYYFCYLATIRALHINAGRGEPCGKVSRYVAVVQIILALTSIVTILSGIINLEITGILSGAGRLFGMILFGVWILRYRNGMQDYEE